jgi:carbamoyltransferase
MITEIMIILGLSAYYHDSAAALIRNGDIIAAAQEERFSRIKHDPNFPEKAIQYCLEEANIGLDKIDYIVFYDKPLVKFGRLLETYLAYVPRGFRSFVAAMPVWLKDKLLLKTTLKKELAKIGSLKENELPNLLFSEHHRSHAASAFFPSPFQKAAVLCLDGVGEWATSSVWLGEGNNLTPKWQMNFPHSLGLLYSAFTYYTGFKVNSGEYKMMGLAPYGEPKYVDLILDNLLDLKEDGTFRLNMSYFNFATGLTMTSRKFEQLFGGPPRREESEITQREMDLAQSIHKVTEEIILKIATTIHKELDVDYLCLAGGVALNCVANGLVLREGPFKDIWVQPAAGDSGGSLGAALSVWHEYLNNPRNAEDKNDSMQGSYLGKHFTNDEIKSYLDQVSGVYVELGDLKLMPALAKLLADGNVVGWFSGRMEFGPRALGGRSILGDPRSLKMHSIMNLKIKYRESFRPFAPAVKAEKVSDWFEIERPSPYMLFVAPVKNSKRAPVTGQHLELFGIDKLNITRSEISSVTHVDYSARIQTVHKNTNPRFYALIDQFEKHTDCPVLINTSFNVRGEPIVCSPEDAYRCFMRTEMDYLIMENILLAKSDQHAHERNDEWKKSFALD